VYVYIYICMYISESAEIQHHEDVVKLKDYVLTEKKTITHHLFPCADIELLHASEILVILNNKVYRTESLKSL
jgi:hypothetical protein